MEYKLPSGRKLKVNIASFNESEELFEAVCKVVDLNKHGSNAEFEVILSQAAINSITDKDVKAKALTCMERCLIDGEPIDMTMFDKHREDFLDCKFIVIKENCYPFLKGLVQKYSGIIGSLLSFQRTESSPEKTT